MIKIRKLKVKKKENNLKKGFKEAKEIILLTIKFILLATNFL